MACTQEELDALLNELERLRKILASPVLEVEQPQMGRTQYRTVDEMERQLRLIDSQIGACLGVSAADNPAVQRYVRRPLFPTVREV